MIVRSIELTADAALGRFSLDASYAYSRSTVRDSGALHGFTPSQSPRHAASATLGCDPAPYWSRSGTLRYVGRQFEDDLEKDVLPDALALDAVASLPLGRHVAVVGRAENVFDEKVVTRNQAGSIDLGTPRRLWIGVRLD